MVNSFLYRSRRMIQDVFFHIHIVYQIALDLAQQYL